MNVQKGKKIRFDQEKKGEKAKGLHFKPKFRYYFLIQASGSTR